MPRVHLPPGCAGFSDDSGRIMAERGPGSFVHIDDDRQLAKLKNQAYASAGLADVGPETYFSRRTGGGRYCPDCHRVWNRWNSVCVKCGGGTVPEAEMPRDLPVGPWIP